ncbi:hypothetical protein ACOMHN_031790 [Nucella lapillus]
MTWNDCPLPATSDPLDTFTSSDSTLSALMSAESGQDQEHPSPVSATASDVTAVGISPPDDRCPSTVNCNSVHANN